MRALSYFADKVAFAMACDVLGVVRSTAYRYAAHGQKVVESSPPEPRHSPRSLSESEKSLVLNHLHGDRFIDKSPQEVYATLLDEEIYLCSVRTMYRILDEHSEVRERRGIVQRPRYQRPELLATAPNQVWSWDITKLLGPAKWTYFYLYVLLDIFSRYVVGWCVAGKESAQIAKTFIEETCQKQGVEKGNLTIHSDRGSPMISKPVAFLLADLGVTKSLSRPSVSNDNPYSESQFKTTKYHPGFPERFGAIQDSRSYFRGFFPWYNDEHHHAGIGYFTPKQVHYGLAPAAYEARAKTLSAAYLARPERFVRKAPQPRPVPTEAWINPPLTSKTMEENTTILV